MKVLDNYLLMRDPADLVEWLVRCAEEPATRWEGAYELDLSASMLFHDSANSEEDAEDPDDGEESEGEDQSETHAAEQVQEAEVNEEQYLLSAFAALLTESQRNRLVDALISAENIEEGDSLLMALVSHWNDPRLVPFLVSQLRREVDSPHYVAQQMMDIVAEALGDKRLASLAEKFGESFNDITDTDDEQATRTESAETSDGAVIEKQKAVLQAFLTRVEKKMQ